jgi:hypothetical protein
MKGVIGEMKNFSFNPCSSSSLRIFLSTLLLFSILLASTCPVQSTSTTTISVSPSTVTVNAGQNFRINVTISSVSDLYGWQFALNWSTSLLDLVNVTEGPFLKSSGNNTYFNYNLNATAGSLIADCTLLGNVPGVSGSGVLATITFYVKNSGQCPLDFIGSDVELYDSNEQPISLQTTNGYGYFVSPPNIAVTNLSISPLMVLPGAIVNINVTVENQATVSENFNVTVYADSGIIGKKSVSLNSNLSKIIPFTWNTTGFGEGDYTISASSSSVPGEVNGENNTKVADTPVTILYNGHDIAVISVKHNPVIYQGYSTSINVTVKDYGIFTETFNTTIHVNILSIQTLNSTLASGKSTQLTFAWNTTGFARDNYTIWAYASPVPGETNLANNNCTGGSVLITVVGDLGGGVPPQFCKCDGKVGGDDLALFLDCYHGTAPKQYMYLGDLGGPYNATDPTPTFFKCDGVVDGKDLDLFLQCYRGLGPDN